MSDSPSPPSLNETRSLARLSTVRDDSAAQDRRTTINQSHEADPTSDTSDFDIIESIIDLHELNEGI